MIGELLPRMGIEDPRLVMPTAPTLGPAPPTPIVWNAPTAFYSQHHTIEAPAINEREFRPAWRVKMKLMLLLKCERIDHRQLEAALAFRGWCEAVGRQRTSTWLGLRVDGGRRSDGPVTVRQLDSPRAGYTTPARRSAPNGRGLVWALVDDLPWTVIGKRLRLSTKTATCWTVEAIGALALWRAREPVPPARVTRLRIEPGRW